MMKIIFLLLVILLVVGGFVALWYFVSNVLRRRREADEDRKRALDAETLRQLHDPAGIGYTPGQTIPREFRSGVQNKKG
jgi:hypothetical protein